MIYLELFWGKFSLCSFHNNYNDIRTRFHLPSQIACSVCREVGATYKGLWSSDEAKAARLKRYAELRRSLDIRAAWKC